MMIDGIPNRPLYFYHKDIIENLYLIGGRYLRDVGRLVFSNMACWKLPYKRFLYIAGKFIYSS